MKRITASLLAMIFFLCGCGSTQPQAKEDAPIICVVLKAMNSVHWMSVENGLKQAASDYGVSVNILYPKSENDVQAQEVMIRNAIASKPDAIAVAPCDSGNMKILKQAEQHDVQVFYIDTSSDQYQCPYIGSNNYQIGVLAAQEFASKLDSGEIAVIAGSLLQSTHKERAKGFGDYIQDHTNLKICTMKENPNSGDIESMQSMQEILEEYPKIKGVFCTSAMMVLGAMQKRNEQQRSDVLLVGVDAQSDALLAVQQGEILAMIGQDGYQIGYQTVRSIVQALNGAEIEDMICVENDLITQENVEEYLSDYGK